MPPAGSFLRTSRLGWQASRKAPSAPGAMEGGHRGWEGVRHWPKSKRFGGKSVQGADKPQAPLADSPAGAMAIPPLDFPSGWSLPSSSRECGQRTASVCRAARIHLTSLRAAASARQSTAGHLAPSLLWSSLWSWLALGQICLEG